MPRVRRASGFPQRQNRANRSWAGIEFEATTAAAGAKVLIGGFTLSNPGIDETILRTRGSVMTAPTTPTADHQTHAAWGMIVVNDLAVAAGVASIPGPVTDRGDDGWLVWEPLQATLDFSTAVGKDYKAGAVFPFDSKAKRIIEEGFQIAIVVENAAAAGTISFSGMFRALTMVRGTR